MMNSSDDVSPDNSPSSSPVPMLPPLKAKRQPAARPTKPQPRAPNDLVLKIKPPVTKPRSSANVLPRKRTLQTVWLPVEEPFVDADPDRYYMQEPPAEKPRVKKPRVEKPVPIVEEIDLQRRYAEEPPEKPRIKKARVEKPVPFVDEYDIERHFVEELPAETTRLKKPSVEKPAVVKARVEKPAVVKARVERPAVEKPPHIEKTRAEKPQVEKPRVEKFHVEKLPRVEQFHIEKPRVEKPKIQKPRIEMPRIEQPRIEKPQLDQHPKRPKVKLPKAAAIVVPKPPKQAKQKVVPEEQEYPESGWQVLDAPSLQSDQNIAPQQDYSGNVVHDAANQLEDLLETTTSMIDELRREDGEGDRLEEEKRWLLDQLLVCEGLIEKPYPTYNPHRPFIPVPPTKPKVKRVKKAVKPHELSA